MIDISPSDIQSPIGQAYPYFGTFTSELATLLPNCHLVLATIVHKSQKRGKWTPVNQNDIPREYRPDIPEMEGIISNGDGFYRITPIGAKTLAEKFPASTN